jgi:branched-subunit amino acid ABC-type transport system permease component
MLWLQRTLDGILEAGPYALIGLGLTLGFGVLRRLNLAYGATAMLAAYLGSWLHLRTGWPMGVVWLSVIGATVVAGRYVEWLCFEGPLGSADRTGSALQRRQEVVSGTDVREVTALAASFAVWMQLEQLAVNWQPNHLHPFPDVASTHEWAWGALTLRPDRLLVWIFAALLMWVVSRGITHSTWGLGVRAVASQPTAAHLSGMPVQRLQRQGFAWSGVVAGVAACAVLSMDGQVTPMFGMWMLIKGLAVALLAGLGRIRRVMMAAVLLGVVESHAQALWGPIARDAVAWALLLLALLWQAERARAEPESAGHA